MSVGNSERRRNERRSKDRESSIRPRGRLLHGAGYTKGVKRGNSEEKIISAGHFGVAARRAVLLNGRVRIAGAEKFFNPCHASFWLVVSLCALIAPVGVGAEKGHRLEAMLSCRPA